MKMGAKLQNYKTKPDKYTVIIHSNNTQSIFFKPILRFLTRIPELYISTYIA